MTEKEKRAIQYAVDNLKAREEKACQYCVDVLKVDAKTRKAYRDIYIIALADMQYELTKQLKE